MIVEGLRGLQLRPGGVNPTCPGNGLQVKIGHNQHDDIPGILVRIVGGLEILRSGPRVVDGSEVKHRLGKKDPGVENTERPENLGTLGNAVKP